MYREAFIGAIHAKKKIRVTFYSKEDTATIQRTCAPMDYGPSRRAHEKNDRFHFWDYDSDKERHVLSLNPEQLTDMRVLDEDFEPSEFVTWRTPWLIPRDWGAYS
jgi:hypothetical protein